MNSKKLFDELVNRIDLPEYSEEIKQLVFMAMEHVFGLSSSKILAGIEINYTPGLKSRADAIVEQLNQHKPIQYILGNANFFGRSFFVNPSVLIPRQETEELISLVRGHKPLRILDIGTGSGCIAISLKLELPQAKVYATDISKEALTVAKQNAKMLLADVDFHHHDILHEDIPIKELSMVVSNPPYVTRKEIETMKPNVLNHEPHLALFVENNDPLVFYTAIAKKSRQALVPGGSVHVEINENLGKDVAGVFLLAGYKNISIHKDIHGKDRIVSAYNTQS